MVAKKQSAVAKKNAAQAAKNASPAKKRKLDVRKLYTERCPEKHQATGKYKFFYILFACTTLFFMALSVWLFVFASELQNKYESIEACARAHTSCHITTTDEGWEVESANE